MSGSEPTSASIVLVVPETATDARLDSYLAGQLPQYSRVHIRRLINAKRVTVDGRRAKAAHRLRNGEQIHVELIDPPRAAPQPEDIPLEVLYEDDFLVAINKPPGMVVHPAKGHWAGTLTAALQFHFDRLSSIGGATRPGIVHRLDRDTSGIILVAKDDLTHRALAMQFEKRTIEKEYFAIVRGRPDRDRDTIDQPIGLHPYQREKMAIRKHDARSRQARSFYEVIERFDGFATMRIAPKTGRTHQIRVHLSSINCAVLCDRQYAGHASIARGDITRDPADAENVLARQALHALRLQFVHPTSGELLSLEAPIPADLQYIVDLLRQHRRL